MSPEEHFDNAMLRAQCAELMRAAHYWREHRKPHTAHVCVLGARITHTRLIRRIRQDNRP